MIVLPRVLGLVLGLTLLPPGARAAEGLVDLFYQCHVLEYCALVNEVALKGFQAEVDAMIDRDRTPRPMIADAAAAGRARADAAWKAQGAENYLAWCAGEGRKAAARFTPPPPAPAPRRSP
ncbi:MAG: hypothetical protein EXQ96_01710 [Alphaproteobacteria bacterium]|nr:hypothetical protein [Alphaproteobacteria bacterium]